LDAFSVNDVIIRWNYITHSLSCSNTFHTNNYKLQEMKKQLYLLAIIFGLSASSVFSMNSDPKTESDSPVIPDKKENKLSDEEVNRLSRCVEEIRDRDKSNMTVKEHREMKKELKATKKELQKDSPYIYVGGATLIFIVILIILLV
jgi:hypothetical protein